MDNTKFSGLTRRDWQNAIDVQDACNLSGVVHTFSDVISRIWWEANKRGEGTNWVNTHPIVVLYVSKLATLSDSDSCLAFSRAYETVTKHLEETKNDQN